MRTVNKVTAAVAGVAALVFSLGACSSSDEPSSTPSGSSGGESSAAATEAEVFTWWADGSEKAGLDALVAVFDQQHPNVKFVNAAVSGGGGSNAKPVLASRLASNDPPDSFQAHAGAELTDYINAGQVQDVSSLYDEFGLRDAFPADLIDRLTVDGKIYSIPSNIHRANVTWANVSVLKAAGLPTDPAGYASMTVADWIEALQKVKDAGKTPISVGGSWTQVQLMENILLAELGADGYNGLWDGSTDWAGADVTQALKDYSTILDMTNKDRDGLDWAEPTKSVEDGDAAFNVMGDWAEAQFEADSKKLGTDYIAFPTPGTNGVFDFLADSFTLPVGAPHPDGAKAWLETISSKDGQVAFNKAKGSIPARSDVDTADFSEYQQTAIKSFGSDTIVSSLAHGAAAPASVLSDITDAISKFSAGSSSVDELQAALVNATKG